MKLRHRLQGRHGILHGLHADEQKAQTQHDLADGPLPPALDEHVKQDAHRRQDRPQKSRLEQRQQKVVGGDIPQAQQLRRHGGADIGAHDDAHRLTELHDPGVDKADTHNRGGRRALDQSGDHRTQQNAFEDIAGQPLQNIFQTAAGELLQAVRHR